MVWPQEAAAGCSGNVAGVKQRWSGLLLGRLGSQHIWSSERTPASTTVLCQELSPSYHWEMGCKLSQRFLKVGADRALQSVRWQAPHRQHKANHAQSCFQEKRLVRLSSGGHMQNTLWVKNHQGQIEATHCLVQVPGLPRSTWPLHKGRLAENANSLEQANSYSPCTRTKSWDSDFFFCKRGSNPRKDKEQNVASLIEGMVSPKPEICKPRF